MTVLHHAQTVGSDLQQHVRCLHVEHLRHSDRKNTDQSLLCLGTMTRQQQGQEGRSEPCGVLSVQVYDYTNQHPNHSHPLNRSFSAPQEQQHATANNSLHPH